VSAFCRQRDWCKTWRFNTFRSSFWFYMSHIGYQC